MAIRLAHLLDGAYELAFDVEVISGNQWHSVAIRLAHLFDGAYELAFDE